jgi:predicted amino acid dehydrogenase
MRQRRARWITDKIETAVQVARDAGCHVVGFGGYTSIVTAGCRRVRTNGVALTTGNALTVGMGVAALRAAAREQGIDLATSPLAVLGATGNIASTYAALMAPEVGEVILIVRSLALSKLTPLLAALRAASPGARVRVVDDLAALADCPLIVTASSTPAPLIHPHHLGRHPVVICDISLPSNVADEVALECPNVRVVQGGVVRLPLDETFAIGGIPLAHGHVFACMAETLLMGLEERWEHASIGPVTVAGVQHAMVVAAKHGFVLGDLPQHVSASGHMGVGYARHQRRHAA